MHTTVYAAGFYGGQLKLNLILAKKCAELLSNCLDDLTADIWIGRDTTHQAADETKQ
jgi:hypothetical protein